MHKVSFINFAVFADDTIRVTIRRANRANRTSVRLHYSDWRIKALLDYVYEHCDSANWDKVNALKVAPYMMNDYRYDVNSPEELMRGYVSYRRIKF